MTNFTQVDPNKFIDQSKSLPATGRGAWNRRGIGFDYRYMLSPKGTPRLGTQADQSLDHWAVSAGCNALRQRLMGLGYIDAPGDADVGRFGTSMDHAVRAFQHDHRDPRNGAALVVDGRVADEDARALWTPVFNQREEEHDIPNHWLRGMINFESGGIDPGAVGYYIYYPVTDADGNPTGEKRFGGVDRGFEMNNSKANPTVAWTNCFDAGWAIKDAAERMDKRHDDLKAKYPKQSDTVLWEAAVCSHNSPVNGDAWARAGGPTNEVSRKYVAGVRSATYGDFA